MICRTANCTDTLARHLEEQLGHTRVYHMRHGITGWIGENNPVIKN